MERLQREIENSQGYVEEQLPARRRRAKTNRFQPSPQASPKPSAGVSKSRSKSAKPTSTTAAKKQQSRAKSMPTSKKKQERNRAKSAKATGKKEKEQQQQQGNNVEIVETDTNSPDEQQSASASVVDLDHYSALSTPEPESFDLAAEDPETSLRLIEVSMPHLASIMQDRGTGIDALRTCIFDAARMYFGIQHNFSLPSTYSNGYYNVYLANSRDDSDGDDIAIHAIWMIRASPTRTMLAGYAQVLAGLQIMLHPGEKMGDELSRLVVVNSS